MTDHQSLDIKPDLPPGAFWQRYQFQIPDSWRSKDLRLVADDRSTATMGWLAFSAPIALRKYEAFDDARRLLLRTALFNLLIFLPGFTLAAFALSGGIHGVIKLGLIMLAGIAAPGYFLFFVFVVSARAGFIISSALPFVYGALLAFLLFRLSPANRKTLLRFCTPLALTFFASLGILALGYLYNISLGEPNLAAATRFSHPLPSDNKLPFLLAEGLLQSAKGTTNAANQEGNTSGHRTFFGSGIPRPLDGDWLSSDRPPLQTGIVLALSPWMKHPVREQLWYHVISVSLQSLWIFAIWLLLRAFRIARLTTGLVIATIYLTGFTIVNTFFVWPKLLAGAYMVAFAIPWLSARLESGRRSWMRRCLLGFLLACSLLAHGGALFALLGLMLCALFRYRRRVFIETCFVGVITVLFYSPWIAYQKYVDPPGDRLVKLHLAGVEQITPEPPLKAIYAAYRNLTFSRWLAVKEADTMQVFGHEIEYAKAILRFPDPQAKLEVRGLEFFFVMPSLGVAALGVICLLWRRTKGRKRGQMRAAERLLLWAFATTIPWILILFIPLMTIVHAGAYAMGLAAMTGGILAFRTVTPWLATAACVLSWIFHWLIYEPDLTNVGFPPSLVLQTNHWLLALHLASLCGFFAVLAFGWNHGRRR